jgi:hypothetical protein
MPYNDNELPNRLMLLMLIADPKWTKSRTENDDPNLEAP